MKKTIFTLGGTLLFTLALLAWSLPGSAGIVLISGDDADEEGHCYSGADGTLCGSLYPNAFNLAISSSTSPGTGIVAIGGAHCGTAGNALRAWNSVANGGPGADVTILTSTTAIEAVNLADFDMLYIPSIHVQLGGFCGLEDSQLAALNTLGPQIQTFVNVTGGSVVALIEADAPNKPAIVDPWGWLPFPFVTRPANFGNVTTTVNMAQVSPTTTDSNLSHCCFHMVFETPLPSGFLSLANSSNGPNRDPLLENLGKPTYVMANIISPENCTDEIDNDGDGLIDKDDPDCLICGDGILDSTVEQCDDGNFASGDGCDQFCQLEGPQDADSDGVVDSDDVCPDTLIPEGVPSVYLTPNHWALTDIDLEFDTLSRGKGNGPGRSYNTTDTAGCSCEQIIAALELGNGHSKFGCSISAMDDWFEIVNP